MFLSNILIMSLNCSGVQTAHLLALSTGVCVPVLLADVLCLGSVTTIWRSTRSILLLPNFHGWQIFPICWTVVVGGGDCYVFEWVVEARDRRSGQDGRTARIYFCPRTQPQWNVGSCNTITPPHGDVLSHRWNLKVNSNDKQYRQVSLSVNHQLYWNAK